MSTKLSKKYCIYEKHLSNICTDLRDLVKKYYLLTSYHNDIPLDKINIDYVIIVEVKNREGDIFKYFRLPFLKNVKFDIHFNTNKILDCKILFTYLPKCLGMDDYLLDKYTILDNRELKCYSFGYIGAKYL